MNFEDAIRKSISAYYKGVEPENLNSTKEEVVYTREYFDELEEDLLGKKSEDKDEVEGEEDGS
jgi:hypothetical protein